MDAFPHDSIRGELAAPINAIAVQICEKVEADPTQHLDRIRVGCPESIDAEAFRRLLKERLSLSGLDFIDVEIETTEEPVLLETCFSNAWAE